MLLDEKQVVLNELIVNLREAADHFTDAADHLDDVQLKALFRTIRDEHIEAAEALSEAVRQTGALPRAQHADREEVHQLITHVRAAVSEDSSLVFLRDRIEHEQQIALSIAEARTLDMPSDTEAYLSKLLTTESAVLSRLNAALTDCVS